MRQQKSDYKDIAVQYYLVEDKTQEELFMISHIKSAFEMLKGVKDYI